ncbi:WD40 repeat domain-containing protein [Actinoplanes sp. M2I2]|uniref:WD40 repeat domain-containing protein n=1 Tax=Actinoplanes sp. M2I2 TaxID=1734444 RepID=UPI00202239A6|nr:WD40 repeat domain-containing protein [Actinoplanes sp. M2I2]
MLIDPWRVLTSSVPHDRTGPADQLWVAFPKAGVPWTIRRRVVSIRADAATDVAVLVLDEPAPHGVEPAPLSAPDAADLVGERWWAFGFPAGTAFGGDGRGHVGAALSYGRMRLEPDPDLGLTDGFVGAAVWSPRFEAVVGLISRVQVVGGRAGEIVALTVAQATGALPEEHLHDLAGWSAADAGESALAAWGWSLESDVEAARHWLPRSRGVAVDSEPGYRFRGRRAALSAVVDWLGRPRVDDRVLVVTGSPGVGKSAVLGRVVTTSDPAFRDLLPAGDDAVRAGVGTVACAVHVKGKTALDVAVEIARAAAVRIPQSPDELAPALRRRLADRRTSRFNLVIDALDEAVSPEQAQQIVEDLVLPVVRTCGSVGVQVVVGTRRSDDGGDLLQLFGADCEVVDLDSERFFEVEDLTAYASATLRLVGDERTGNPYAPDHVAGPVAARIAELADRNFLVAGLTARRHGLYDHVAVRPEDLAFSPDVDDALEAYVDRLPEVGRLAAKPALTALAYAQAPGLSLELWQTFLAGFGVTVEQGQLADFARSSAANFLVESSGDGPGPRFRLFHQALNDALLRERRFSGATVADQRAISDHLIRHGRAHGWAQADQYLLRSLAEHAVAAGLIDELLVDDEYLLYADLLRLVPPADYARTILGQQRARLLRLTPQAVPAGPSERAAQFSVTAVLEGLDSRVAVNRRAPYRASWAAVQKRREWAVLEGHTGVAGSICVLTARSGELIVASGGSDGTVRTWDPRTGQQRRVMLAGADVVELVPVRMDGRTLVASAGADGTVLLWDPESGQLRHSVRCEPDQIRALTPAPRPGDEGFGVVCADGSITVWSPVGRSTRRNMIHTGKVSAAVLCGPDRVISAGADGSLQYWTIGAPEPGWVAAAHSRAVTALCLLPAADQGIVVSGSADGTVRIGDAATGTPLLTIQVGDPIRAMCPVNRRGGPLLATAGDDGIIRLWDAWTGRLLRAVATHGGPIRRLCAVEVQGRVLIATVGDAAVRLWDPDFAFGPRTGAASTSVTALAAIRQGSRDLVAAAYGNGTVQLLNTATGEVVDELTGHRDAITDLAPVFAYGKILLASAGADETVGLWELRKARQRAELQPRPGWSSTVCAVFLNRHLWLACAGEEGTVRLWDPFTGRRRRRTPWRRGPRGGGPISVLVELTTREGPRVVSGGTDCTLRVWNIASGRQETVFSRHTGRIRAACVLPSPAGELVASAGDDQVIRVWDPRTGDQRLALRGHTGRVTAVCPIRAGNRLLLASTGHDGTVRLWNPATGAGELTIPIHHEGTACAAVADELIVGTTAGALALSLSL